MKIILSILLSLLCSLSHSKTYAVGKLWHACRLVSAEGEQAIISLPIIVNLFIGKKLSEDINSIKWDGYLTLENRNKSVYLYDAKVEFDKTCGSTCGGYKIDEITLPFSFIQIPVSERILSYKLSYDENNSGTYDCMIADPDVRIGH